MADDPIPASDPVLTRDLGFPQVALQDRDRIAKRREIVGYLYCVRHMPMRRIVEYLQTQIQPAIICEVPTISKDVKVWREAFREKFAANRFDALVAVGQSLASFHTAAAKAWALMELSNDFREKANLLRVYLEAEQKAVTLLQDVGLLDRRIGTLHIDDPTKAGDRVPSGLELQKLFESVTIAEGELVSEAERAWMYGDAAAAEEAARGASDGDNENR